MTMKHTTGRMKRFGMALPLITALLGTTAYAQDASQQDQAPAQTEQTQEQTLRSMDELESFLEVQDDDKNTLAYRQYVFTLKKELFGEDYTVRSPDLTEDVLVQVNEMIQNDNADDIITYGIGETDTKEEFYRNFSVRYGTPEAETLIREIQDMAGLEQTGEISNDQNVFEFYKTATFLYHQEQEEPGSLVADLAQERQQRRELQEENQQLEERIETQQQEYENDLAMYQLITLSSGQEPVPESYIENVRGLQDRVDGEGEDAQAAQTELEQLNSALYDRVIETYIESAETALEENKYEKAAQQLALAKSGYEAVREVQLDLDMYDRESLVTLDTEIDNLTDRVAEHLDEESIKTSDQIASDLAERSYELQQDIISLRETEKNARPGNWREQIEGYNEQQESIYRGLIGFHIDEARQNRENGNFNKALENLTKAQENYELIVETQKGTDDTYETVDRDLSPWIDSINRQEHMTELAQAKADDTLQDNRLTINIMPYLQHSAVINEYSMDDGAGTTLVDIRARDTDWQSGLEVSSSYNHRTDDFITGIRDMVLRLGLGTHLLSGKDNMTDETFGSSSLFSGGLTENGYIEINGQLFPYAGARLVEKEDGGYLLDIYGKVGGAFDWRSGSTDDVSYTDSEWSIGGGLGTTAHWLERPNLSFSSWLDTTYLLNNYQETDKKGHTIEGRLGTNLTHLVEGMSQLVEAEGVYRFNITPDNETYHTIALEGRLGSPLIHLKGGIELLNTQETNYSDPFDGSITPGTSWYAGIEFSFDLGKDE